MDKDPIEQDLGKRLYAKHKENYRTNLANGYLPQIEEYPEHTKKNVMAGIAYSAMEEEDYETAFAFFSQLGGEYDELARHSKEMLRRNPAGSDNSSLMGRIEGILSYQTRHSFVKNEVAKLAEDDYILLCIKEGRFTLAEKVEELEKSYKRFIKLGWRAKREKREEMKLYFEKSTLAIFDTFAEFYAEDDENFAFYKANGSKKQTLANIIVGASATLTGTGFIGGMGSLFFFDFFFGPIIALGSVLFLFGMPIAESLCNKGVDIDRKLRSFREKVKKIDKEVQSAFMPEIYLNNPGLFKEKFEAMDVPEQKLVIKEILQEDTQKNKALNEWLCENYKEIIDEEGRWNLAH